MIASPDDLAGLEMLYKIYKPTIRNKSDVAILFTHFTLCIQCRMNCIGVGEETHLVPSEQSEDNCAFLPDGWNKNSKTYVLRYSHESTIYTLSAKEFENGLIIRLADLADKRSSSFVFNVEEHIDRVGKSNNQIKTLIPKAEKLAERLQKQLIKPVLEMSRDSQSSRELGGSTDMNPLSSYSTIYQRNYPYRSDHLASSPSFGLPFTGRSDLHPFGSGDFAGNLFPNTFRNPRGMMPRIYPTTPMSNGRGTSPNFNHLQPPGWGFDDFI
ncbi:proteasome inhibitor PI31 subunit-like [Anastrepha obliqua]|uniref:proteasome inhibitor PI31 subunit-like n=1 Tax=Anastrepha obliqua TaxID=95512 RepID=UPI002409C60A|nr:proteasome inhibitor PI31 subunit-like [Anastrepha obliqua]